VILAVDPVPWARAQMAFTLACHIILVPLGVSWACMTLVANWRAIKRDDHDALLLAQRWSKYMAVTFAVGAVTGTVLTFEFGLLWPRFMGRWGAAFGIPFSVEGLFFFIEAIFIALYIFGWRRLRPWPHFWTGIPIVLAGIGGTLSVIAANAWMNEPAGFTLNDAGDVVDVDPLKVFFNEAWPYEASHMLVAAYLVGGFLVASVYAVGCSRAAATATTGWASSSRSRSPRSPRPSRWSSATRWLAGCTTTSPPSSPPSSSCPRPRATCPRRCWGASTPTAR
jgi:cytochrome d ubiquinol oxidase subunit I